MTDRELAACPKDAEIARLNAALRYEQHRAERIGTHGPGCERWGPAHYECLLREAEGLRRDAERYRAWRLMAVSGTMSDDACEMMIHARTESAVDAAIDAAREG